MMYVIVCGIYVEQNKNVSRVVAVAVAVAAAMR